MNLTLEIATMNVSDYKAEAKELRARIQSRQAEAARIEAELPALEAEAESYSAQRMAGEHRLPDRATEVSARRGQIANRLREIATANDMDEGRLRVLDRRIEAGPTLERRRTGLREAEGWLAAAINLHASTGAAVQELERLSAECAAKANKGQHSRATALLAAVGIEHGADQGERVEVDDAANERELRAIERAKTIATGKLDQLSRDVEAARQAVQTATEELAAAAADVVELEHAEALAAYLPVLCRFVAAHAQAHGYPPELPALDSMIADALPDAEAAFTASLGEPSGGGVVAKAARAVRGMLS